MDKIKELLDYKLIDKKEIPGIDLYMDQLTFLLDENLSKLNRNEGEKNLTKTMINNYVKAKVLEAPIKKKYSRDQIMKLTMIYQMKNVLSISDLKVFFDMISKSDEKIDEYYDYYKGEQERVSRELERFKSYTSSKEGLDNYGDNPSIIDKDMIKDLISLSIESDIKRRLSELLIDHL